MKISYDWRGMPVEFKLQDEENSSDSTRLAMMYDGSGRRISKTLLTKSATAASWDTVKVTHYTGIGTEIREEFHDGSREKVNVVVNMPVFFRVTLTRLKPRSYIEKDILRLSNGGAILPKQSFGASRQGLGRYGIEDAENPDMGSGVGYIPNTKFEWYLKNHLGSTMLVYGTQADANPTHSDIGTPLAAYDYRAFGEMVELTPPSTGKVTENFTGKERDDEIALDYFGARYLDPMLGMWISVDPARQFASPYLYAGNGYNPVNGVDPDGNTVNVEQNGNNINYTMNVNFLGLADDGTTFAASEDNIRSVINAVESFFTGTVTDGNTTYNIAMKVVYNPEAENIVYIKDKIGESTSWATDQYTRKNLDIVCNDRALIFMKSSGFETTTPHEFAHLMGIKDRYTIWRDKNGIKHSKPHKGFKGNKYENFDPWNNR